MTKYRAPKMPKELNKTGVDGTVQLRLVVDRDGKLKSIELVEGVHEKLDQNILDAARKWRFEPGEIQGRPVEGVMRWSIEYVRGGDPDGRVTRSARRWRN